MTSHLHQEPDDLRALLLQAYILSFGLQDDAGASAVYRQVIERAGAEGAYRELAEEGLRQCGAAGPSPAAAAERAVIPVLSPGDDDAVERLPATPWLQEEPQLVPAPGPGVGSSGIPWQRPGGLRLRLGLGLSPAAAAGSESLTRSESLRGPRARAVQAARPGARRGRPSCAAAGRPLRRRPRCARS